MGLILSRPDRDSCPDYGVAIVGESLRNPMSESLMDVWPIEEFSEVHRIANMLQDNEKSDFSWFVMRVSFSKIVYIDETEVKARYVEASDLTHPLQKRAAA